MQPRVFGLPATRRFSLVGSANGKTETQLWTWPSVGLPYRRTLMPSITTATPSVLFPQGDSGFCFSPPLFRRNPLHISFSTCNFPTGIFPGRSFGRVGMFGFTGFLSLISKKVWVHCTGNYIKFNRADCELYVLVIN